MEEEEEEEMEEMEVMEEQEEEEEAATKLVTQRCKVALTPLCPTAARFNQH